ncbi:hypothetical protein AQUCO_00900001v1 [Aquilegia coerulea]|uniref:Uncharacterized protein n=1 Tax=Aquilegia coerulea TaxID=218851 RepID=A0A2G5EBD2_AQUCA|nr:hypothetical protein AQUCO_00900001v1 [Aquilegia coerulea]
MNMGDPSKLHVKVRFCLASELYCCVDTSKGALSERLVSIKEESMCILKDFITKHNVPTDIPEELSEASEDDDEVSENPPKKRK